MVLKRAALSVTGFTVGATSRLTLTVSVPGANVGDPVLLTRLDQVPDALQVWGRVTAPGTVTVVAYNPTAADIPAVPLSGTFLYVAVIEA